MPLLEILPDTNPVMRKTSRRIRRVDTKLRKLVKDMYETMVDQWGVGLAAVQVGVPRRLFIYEIPNREMKGYETCSPDKPPVEGEVETIEETGIVNPVPAEEGSEPEPAERTSQELTPADLGYTGNYFVCINPRITEKEGKFIDDEGCLSKSGWMAKVERALKITFQAHDIDMRKFERTVTGLEARCVQHEIDHMDGILFTDRAIPDTLREVTGEEEEKTKEPGAEATQNKPQVQEMEGSAVGSE